MPNDTYVPGICNIGPGEIAKRRQGGWAGTIVAVVLFAIMLAVHAAPAWRLLLFLPLSAATIGFFQAGLHFCVGFGFVGIYNVLKPAGETETVEKAEFRAADRAKAMAVLGYSLIAAILVTLALVYFP